MCFGLGLSAVFLMPLRVMPMSSSTGNELSYDGILYY